MADVKTGTTISTDAYFHALMDNWSNDYHLYAHAKKNWSKIPLSGDQIDLLTNAAAIAQSSKWAGGDDAFPANTEANTLFTNPALDWTFMYNIGYSLYSTRAKNRGKQKRFSEKVETERIMARAALKLINDDIATGDGTSNASAGFPAFVKTSGNYAGVTQASGYWQAQSTVAVAGISNLTWDDIENALSVILGRIQGEPGFTYYMNYAVKRYLNTLAQAQQRFVNSGPFDVGTDVKSGDGGGKMTHDGNNLVVDRSFSTNLIYIAPDSVMALGVDPTDESYPWDRLGARIGNQVRVMLGMIQMSCRRPSSTVSVTFT